MDNYFFVLRLFAVELTNDKVSFRAEFHNFLFDECTVKMVQSGNESLGSEVISKFISR